MTLEDPQAHADADASGDGTGLAYVRISDILRETVGIDLTRYKRASVLRRVLRRMRRAGSHDLDDYAEMLARDSAEVATLARDMRVPYIPVFRDPEIRATLLQRLPGLLRGTGRAQIWIPDCGNGEEVYSVAMLLAELWTVGDEIEDFLVFGTDADAEGLVAARAARLNAGAADSLPAQYRGRYLLTDGQGGDGFRVDDDLAKRCVFLQHDLLQPPPFNDIDLICYRNQLMYLELGTQRRILQHLHDALRPGGVLLVGSSESPLSHPDLFSRRPLAATLHLRIEAGDSAAARKPQADATTEQADRPFRALFELAAAPLALLGADLRVLDANAALGQLLQEPERQLTGRPMTELVSAVDLARVQSALAGLAAGAHLDLSAALRRAGGEDVTASLRLARLPTEPNGFLVEVQYSPSDQDARRQLATYARRQDVGMAALSAGVLMTDAAGLVIDLNPQAELLTGWSRGEALNQPHDRVFRLLATSGALAPSPLWTCLRDGQTQAAQEHFLLARDGRRLTVRVTCAPFPALDGGPGGLLVFEDMTQQSLLSEELAYRSTHDPVTGLLNRDEFERRMSTALTEARGGELGHLLCYVDLDQFKVINDTLGHFAGDELLRQLAAVFRSRLRPQDALARLGGDEFGVLLERSDLEQGQPIVDSLLDGARNFRFSWEGQSYTTTASIGVVPMTAHTTSAARALSDADAACYAAKDSGRDRARVADAGDDTARRHTQMSMVGKIGQALDQNLFTLVYEDVVSTTNPDTVLYRELLVRMRRPDGTLQPPSGFIAAAERYYLMTALDRWVVQAALTGIAQRGLDGVIYAINISGLSLSDEKFHHYLVSRLDTLGVAPEQVCFEITETAAISHLSEARRFIERMAEVGCRFALDDFGAGMASFSYLRNLPVNFIKIDGSFVRSMLENKLDRGMVEAINRIGHDMGLKTIAEHVEDIRILEPLRAIGVDWAQGRAIAQARPFDELLKPII